MYKYNVKFVLLPKPRKNGERSIRARISWYSRRVDSTLTSTLPSDCWDYSRERAVNSKVWKDCGVVNSEISSLRSNVDQLFVRCLAEQRIPTEDDVKRAINGKGASPVVSISTIMEEFISEQSVLNSWSDTTALKFNVLNKHLENAGIKKVEELNEHGLQSFVESLNREGLRNSTILKQIGFLKWFMRWCYRKRYIEDQSYELWKPKLKNVPREVIYLDWDELMRLRDYDFGTNYSLDSVRDVFCFCAFTGLRFSDAAKLTWADVASDFISVVTKKTNAPLRIELNKWSRAILDKYRAIFSGDVNGKALPAISNQKSNDYIKVAAEMAGVDAPVRMVSYYGSERVEYVFKKHEVISTHCARRTFVVNALRLGIPAEVVMKWTGHSGFNAMKPYIAIVDELKRKEMDKFNNA